MERIPGFVRLTGMNSRIRSLSVLVAVVVVVVLSACGSQGATDRGGGSARVSDGTYVASSVTVDGKDHPLVAGSRIVLTVKGNQLSLNSGCNLMSGDATWSGGRVTIGDLAMTEMGCAEPLMTQDSWLATVFSGTLAVSGDKTGFTLTKGGTVLTFDPQRPVADAPLAGTHWTLVSIGSGGSADGSVGSVPQGVMSTFVITGDKIQLSPGCNSAGGAVVVTDTTLTAARLVSTMMACGGARDEVERQVMDLFSGPLGYVVDGEQLTLTAADGRFLVYQADHGTDPEPDPAALQGKTWRLVQISHTSHSTATGRSVPRGVKATLRFDGGKVLVGTGCNSGNGSVSLTGETMTVGPLMLTKRACRRAEGSVEGAVLGVLESGRISWSVEGGNLRLVSADGTNELLYRAG